LIKTDETLKVKQEANPLCNHFHAMLSITSQLSAESQSDIRRRNASSGVILSWRRIRSVCELNAAATITSRSQNDAVIGPTSTEGIHIVVNKVVLVCDGVSKGNLGHITPVVAGWALTLLDEEGLSATSQWLVPLVTWLDVVRTVTGAPDTDGKFAKVDNVGCWGTGWGVYWSSGGEGGERADGND
jgi:hypothetical protein